MSPSSSRSLLFLLCVTATTTLSFTAPRRQLHHAQRHPYPLWLKKSHGDDAVINVNGMINGNNNVININGKSINGSNNNINGDNINGDSNKDAKEDAKEETKKKKFDLQILLVDHYDSYTYNLYDMLARRCTKPPLVVTKDDDLLLRLEDMDGIVLSPGPGRPPHDMGRTLDLLDAASTIPILGVCLGHQAVGYACGASIVECTTPVHGQVHEIQLWPEGNDLWKGMNENDDDGDNDDSTTMNVTRYHSLKVENLSSDLMVTATYEREEGDETVIMGLQHKTKPWFGVQFHPESIGTTQGHVIVDNFLNICQEQQQQQRDGKRQRQDASSTVDSTNRMMEDAYWQDEEVRSASSNRITDAYLHDEESILQPTVSLQRRDQAASSSSKQPPLHKPLYISTTILTDVAVSPTQVFEKLYSHHSHAIWLDSSSASSTSSSSQARYSIMGAMTGPLSKRIEYYGIEHEKQRRGVYVTTTSTNHDDDDNTEMTARDESVQDILEYLEEEQYELVYCDDTATTATSQRIPFVGGHLGYLGYEVRHDTQRKLDHGTTSHDMDQHDDAATSDRSTTNPNVPTAAFLFCDQTVVYDHVTNEWHLVEVTEEKPPGTNGWSSDWRMQTEQTIRQLHHRHESPPSPLSFSSPVKKPRRLSFVPNRSRQTYQADIDNCHYQIKRGESYELCLTNQLETTVPASSARNSKKKDAWRLYQILRQRNPAPFAAFVNWQGNDNGDDAKLAICCSSPERFVSIQPNDQNEMIVEAKPIKGTAARPFNHEKNNLEDQAIAHELQHDVKNRAENLMIVDLLRNDLHRVCRNVHVPKLMAIESYATVHQLVSTIRGTLQLQLLDDDTTKKKNGPVSVMTACFPGGSMTGAPKRRTMELLHDMEQEHCRGPYSGCLGYIGLDGRMDMNIVIRSAILTPSNDDDLSYQVSIGAGGAITALSESDDEYEEMLLKARAIQEAVELWADPQVQPENGVSNNPSSSLIAATSLSCEN